MDDDSEPLFKKGRGFYYTNTDNGKILRELIPSVKDKIKKEFYDVHHQLLEKLTQEKLDYYKNIYIIDCHSFTDEPFLTDDDKTKNRPDICLGVDEYHTPQWLVDQLISGFEYFDLSVKINSPYSGTIVPLKYYKLDSRVKSVMIEVNRKLYMRNRTYKEFKLQPEYGDTIGWFGQIDNGPFKNYVEQYFIYATPYHDYLQEIPIDVSWCDLLNRDTGIVKSIEGDGIYWYKINVRDNFKSVEDLFEWYNNFYLPETYDVIMTKLIPEVRDDLEWKYFGKKFKI